MANVIDPGNDYNQDPVVDYKGPGTATDATPVVQNSPANRITLNPGYDPNYPNLIQQDPGYLAAKNAAAKGEADAGAQRRLALRNAIIAYGGLPTGFVDRYGDIDQATLDAAKQNQQSTLSQLQTNYGQNQHALRVQLAARGALQSGDLNYGQDQLDQGYAQQRYDSANTVGNTASGALNAYTGVVDNNATALAQAIAQAESSAENNPAYRPVSATYANYDANSSALYGQPIYKGDDGSMYDANGNAYTPRTSFGGL